jgi:hypothetical protein
MPSIDTLHQYFLSAVDFTHTHQFYFYWLPAILCIFGYLRQIQEEYHKDVASRDEYEKCDNKNKAYYPTLTVGKIVGRVVVSIIPLVNIWKGVYFLFRIGKDIIDIFDTWLNIPLVKKRPKPVPATTVVEGDLHVKGEIKTEQNVRILSGGVDKA